MTAVPVLVFLCLALSVACPPAWQPWVQFAAAALVAGAVTARRGGRPLLGPRPGARRAPVDVVDLVAPDRSHVGCVEGDRIVTTAVEISGGSSAPTEVGRDDPADFPGVRLPLAAVGRQLDRGGPALEGIDVVVRGRRTSAGPDGAVYAALVGPLALISRRRVHLLLRFDLERLAASPGTIDRGDLERRVAVATERVRRALVHHGVPCRVLDAAELAERYLEAEEDARSGDRIGLIVRSGADARTVVDALGAVPAAEATEVLRLRPVPGRPDRVDVVTVAGLTGADPGALPSAATGACRPLVDGGLLPVPGEPLSEELAGAAARHRIADLDLLAPPAHGAGQILGATRAGGASALQLAGPHLRSILLAARPAVCRQVVLRAVASGYRVAVVTDVPDRWRPLLAIADETRYRIVDPDASDAGAPVDAVVWDVAGRLSEARIDAFAGPGGPDVTPPTVIRVDADWGVGLPHDTAAGAPPDLVLDGRIDGWISVEPRGGEPYRVSVVAGPGEERYVGGLAEVTPAGAAPSASPDRR